MNPDDTQYGSTRSLLAGYLEEFKQLEQDEPEIAEKLGFAGYAQFALTCYFGNEQYPLLQKLADGVPSEKPFFLRSKR